MSDKNIFSLAGLTSILILTLATSYLDSAESDLKAEHSKYCELVIMWEYGADAGLEPNEREGHPNYKGAVCEQ